MRHKETDHRRASCGPIHQKTTHNPLNTITTVGRNNYLFSTTIQVYLEKKERRRFRLDGPPRRRALGRQPASHGQPSLVLRRGLEGEPAASRRAPDAGLTSDTAREAARPPTRGERPFASGSRGRSPSRARRGVFRKTTEARRFQLAPTHSARSRKSYDHLKAYGLAGRGGTALSAHRK